MEEPKCLKCGAEIVSGIQSSGCPRGSECDLWPTEAAADSMVFQYQLWEKNMKAALAQAAPVMERLERGSHMLVPCCAGITEDWVKAYMKEMRLSNIGNARAHIRAMLATVPTEQ
jgi:hypothetical protein